MIAFPNCKVNVGLRVTGRRPDGYHDIETVMVPVPWTDVLEIVPARGLESTLTVSGREVACLPEQNLVMKALRAFQSATGISDPVDIYLRKVIPDGAGLGGGSADAAFTLVMLNDMHRRPLSVDELCRLAARLGADCPFFIVNRPMLCTGTGTDMTPADIDLGGLTVTIVKPGRSVSTAEAYRGVEIDAGGEPLTELLARPIGTWQGKVTNAFESTVIPALPEVGEIKRAMIDAGAVYASMSGSGSAVFALSVGDNLADAMRVMFPRFDIFSAKPA